jgi:hypothetical protein
MKHLPIIALLLTACSGFTPRDEPGLYLTIEAAIVPEVVSDYPRHWDSEAMEPACRPDPYVMLLSDDWECVTSAAADTLEPVWGHACDFLALELPVALTWVVLDSDPDADEVIMQGEAGITTEDMVAGELLLNAESVELWLTIEVLE